MKPSEVRLIFVKILFLTLNLVRLIFSTEIFYKIETLLIYCSVFIKTRFLGLNSGLRSYLYSNMTRKFLVN